MCTYISIDYGPARCYGKVMMNPLFKPNTMDGPSRDQVHHVEITLTPNTLMHAGFTPHFLYILC